MVPIDNLEEAINTTSTTNSTKTKTRKKISFSTIFSILWIISFICWLYFAYLVFLCDKTGGLGMWTSLTFVWIFLYFRNKFRNNVR